MKSKRFLSVNWEDGMLIRASHLLDQESYFESLNRWAIRQGVPFFGLISPETYKGSSLEVRVDYNGRDWVIVLTKCHGLTVGGKLIQIDKEINNNLISKPIDGAKDDTLPVYVWAKPSKTGVGLPSGDEEPARHPYRGFDYNVIVGNLHNIDPADCLKIGEIKYAEDKPVLSADYIPPCTVIGAHPLLAEQCRRLLGILVLAQQAASGGYQAYISVIQDKPAKFGIEHKLLQDMLGTIAINLGGMVKMHPDPELPITPYSLFAFYQQIIGTVEAMLSTYRDAAVALKKKYEKEISYNRFLDGIKEFLTGKYNHHESGRQISKLVLLMTDFIEFVDMMKNLAGALPEVGRIISYRNKEYHLQTFRSVASQIERDGVTIKIDGLGNIVSRDVLISINRELLGGVDYRYIMVKIGLNDNDIPGRMDPVYVDAETTPGSLILKPMDDLADPSIAAINLNVRGNFNSQDLKDIQNEMISIYVY